MIELVIWSCVLGFSPLALSMVLRGIALVARLACWIVARPPDAFHDHQVATFFGPHRIDRAGGFGHGS